MPNLGKGVGENWKSERKRRASRKLYEESVSSDLDHLGGRGASLAIDPHVRVPIVVLCLTVPVLLQESVGLIFDKRTETAVKAPAAVALCKHNHGFNIYFDLRRKLIAILGAILSMVSPVHSI